jgi:PDZ domain-containing protein
MVSGWSRRVRTLLLATGLTVGLSAAGAALPVPYVELGPGPTYDTLGEVAGRPLIEIADRQTYPGTGHLNLTTVSVSDPGAALDLGSALRGWLDSRVAVVPREVVYPPGQSGKEVEQRNAADMRASQQHAKTAALRQLGIAVPMTVDVGALSPGSPATGRLNPGDVLLAVDGTAVSSAAELRAAIGRHHPGDQVVLDVRRGNDASTVTVTTAPAPDDPNRAIVGITAEDQPQYPFPITIRLDDVGGPSAGLMFALGIVDRLTPEDITGGRFIAGSGTIDDNGAVGPIGGVKQKIIAAHDKGATVFLAPAGDCAEARSGTPAGVQLVKVDTLTGALAALEQVRTGTGTPPSCG